MMKIKKYLLALIVSIMFISTSPVFGAQDGASLLATLNNNQLELTFVLPKADKGIDALVGTLDYDTNKLELVEVASADSRLKEPVYNNDNGKFTSLIESKTIDGSVNAVKFTFKLKSENVDGMTISVNEIAVAGGDDSKLSLDPASVTIRVEDKKTTTHDKPSDSKKNDGANPPTTEKNENTSIANNSSYNTGQFSSNSLWVSADEVSSAVKDNKDKSAEDKNNASIKDNVSGSNELTNDTSSPNERVETNNYWLLLVIIAFIVILVLLFIFIRFKRGNSKE